MEEPEGTDDTKETVFQTQWDCCIYDFTEASAQDQLSLRFKLDGTPALRGEVDTGSNIN